MKSTALSVAFVLCAAPLLAQGTFRLPTQVPTSSNNIPLGAGQCRFQQWFSAPEWVGALGSAPAQVSGMTLSPGQLGTTTTIELQVALGHGFAVGLNGSFDFNFSSQTTTVFPRRTVNVTAGQPLTLNFGSNFAWNGVDSVVMEIRVFSNGQGGGPFSHENLYTTAGSGKTGRAYNLTSATASNAANVQAGWGLIVDFATTPGSQVDYGAGCPGAGGIVPLAVVTSGIPRPGAIWVHQLQQVNSQRVCFWTIGSDRTTWNGAPLPADLTPFGAAGCNLLHNLEQTQFAVSVGGGPGSGIAQLVISIPPIAPIVGQSWYTQWFVLDEQGGNGLLAASQGIWAVIAP